MLIVDTLNFKGEKLTDDEVDALLTGIEDSQGQVNYEGTAAPSSPFQDSDPCSFFSPFRVCEDGDVWMSRFLWLSVSTSRRCNTVALV